MKKLLLSAVAIAALALASAPQAMAQEEPEPEPQLTFCEGTLANRVIVGNVIVPLGADCVLDRVVVRGDVVGTVDARSLVVKSSVVDGSVLCDGCRDLDLDRSFVRGGLDVTEAGSTLDVCWTSIGGAAVVRSTNSIRIGALPSWNGCGANHFGDGLTISRGRGDAVIAYNVVVGTLSVALRRGATTDIRRNVVTGDLTCTNNDPVPVGGNNHARQRLGQCAAL